MNRVRQGNLFEFLYPKSGKSRVLDHVVFGRRVQVSCNIKLAGDSDLVFRVLGRSGEQIHTFSNLDSTSAPKWVMFFPQSQRQFCGIRCGADLDALELRPFSWEFMPRGKKPHRAGSL